MLREAFISLSPSSYVPLGALNSPNSVLRKIPVNVKPNPEKVEKNLFDRVFEALDPFKGDVFSRCVDPNVVFALSAVITG